MIRGSAAIRESGLWATYWSNGLGDRRMIRQSPVCAPSSAPVSNLSARNSLRSDRDTGRTDKKTMRRTTQNNVKIRLKM